MNVVLFKTSSFSDDLFNKIYDRLKQSTKICVDVRENPIPFKFADRQDRVNVDKLREMIRPLLNEDEPHMIVYTGQDIFSLGLDYVFGKAYLADGICVVSSRRLQDVSDMDRTVERLVNVTLHEVGHLLRLAHCEDPGCVMYRSKDAMSVDRRMLSFCEKCAETTGDL
jgi:archaemetzincin